MLQQPDRTSTAGPNTTSVLVLQCTYVGLASAWIRAAGELDVSSAPDLDRLLREAAGRARRLMLDLRDLEFIDSSGVHVVVGAVRASRARCRITIIEGRAQVRRMFAITGSNDLLETVIARDLRVRHPTSGDRRPDHRASRAPQTQPPSAPSHVAPLSLGEGDTLRELTIREFSARTGVTEGTLRMWERRHAFPSPTREGQGHRRYQESDVDLVRRVVSERSGGVSLGVAIARAQSDHSTVSPSVYAALRRRRPTLEPRTLHKPLLLALTRALEDESASRAMRPFLFGSFQREANYREAEARWRELSWSAEVSVVFADFDRVRLPRGGPIEVPVSRSHPMSREWTVVCCATDHAICLSAWEPPVGGARSRDERTFESIWSVDPEVVWDAARVCVDIAAPHAGGLLEPLAERLARDPEPLRSDQLRLATAVTNRLLSYLS